MLLYRGNTLKNGIIQNSLLNNIESSDNFSFAEHTTYGLGGKAKIAYFPKTEEEAAAVFKYLKDSGQIFIVLGNGSNVLASDNFFDGAVISTKYLKGITAYGGILRCLSGTTVNEVLRFCLENNLGGLEYLSGIPASIGGLALMNGGIPLRHIESDIKSVRIYDGKLIDLSNKKCKFGNKHSTMRDIDCIITSVNLSISAVPREASELKIKNFLSARGIQPKGKNCGCVFKNYNGFSAGKIIEDAGLKGIKIGGAEVSGIHANFIVNNEGTAKDVYSLIEYVKNKVYDLKGIKLEQEVVYIGEFNDFDG